MLPIVCTFPARSLENETVFRRSGVFGEDMAVVQYVYKKQDGILSRVLICQESKVAVVVLVLL